MITFSYPRNGKAMHICKAILAKELCSDEKNKSSFLSCGDDVRICCDSFMQFFGVINS